MLECQLNLVEFEVNQMYTQKYSSKIENLKIEIL